MRSLAGQPLSSPPLQLYCSWEKEGKQCLLVLGSMLVMLAQRSCICYSECSGSSDSSEGGRNLGEAREALVPSRMRSKRGVLGKKRGSRKSFEPILRLHLKMIQLRVWERLGWSEISTCQLSHGAGGTGAGGAGGARGLGWSGKVCRRAGGRPGSSSSVKEAAQGFVHKSPWRPLANQTRVACG